MAKIKKNIILYIIGICIVLQFIVSNSKLGIICYSLIISPLAIYHFPVKPMLDIVNQKLERKYKLYILSEYFVIGAILCLSAIWFIFDLQFIRIVSLVFFICNIVFFGLESHKKSNQNNAFLHFLLMWFMF